MVDKRTFTIVESSIGYSGGYYKGTAPFNVAKKVTTVLFRLAENKKNKSQWKKYEKKNLRTVHFTIRESTARSDKKHYKYDGSREHLKSPIVFNEGKDNEYEIEYKIVVKPK